MERFYQSFILWIALLVWVCNLSGEVRAANGDSSTTTVADNEFTLTYQDPRSCQAQQNETFSSIHLSCIKCQVEIGKGAKPFYQCPCPDQFYRDPDDGRCLPCSNGTISPDQSRCAVCTAEHPYEISNKKCKPCPPGSIQVLKQESGSPKSAFECIQCASGYTPSPDSHECVPCPPSFTENLNGTCKCPEQTHSVINGICFPAETQDVNSDSIYKISYDNGLTIDSSYLRENLLAAYYLCKTTSNETACQVLANMCTLQLYSPDEGDMTACRLYRTLAGASFSTLSTSRSNANILPKLYFADPILLLQRPNLIPYEFSTNFEKTNSDVNISIARFTVGGKFLGLTSLPDIIPCPEKKQIQRVVEKFGTKTSINCMISVHDLWNKYGGRPLLNEYHDNGDDGQMEFLEAYLSYSSGPNSEHKLHSIPIKIQNLKKGGVRINTLQEVFQWFLVKRFFFVDTIGGFEGSPSTSANQEVKPRVVRYLQSLRVDVQLQATHEPGRIFVPLVTLEYAEVSPDQFMRNEMVNFSFDIDYSMDMVRAIEDIKIAIGVISSLSVIWSAIQTWGWNRRNGKIEIDVETLVNLLVNCCGYIADAFFIVCFSTALYWFIFFKKQVAVHVLLPQVAQEKLVRDLIISAFALKIVDILRLIWRQVSIDIFFIDWEKPRVLGTLRSKPPKTSASASRTPTPITNETEEPLLPNVSIWRTYFVANEWNEIQTTRVVHFATHVIVVLFFLEIVGFKHLGLYWANNSLTPGLEARNIPYSSMARFVIGTLVFGIAGVVQWLYRVGFHERYISNKILDFVDVCTLSNISVFILAAQQYGFYIHGRSVHGFADIDMHTMIDQLHREEEDLCGRRGLVPQTDQQTFLISVPRTFRQIYNRVLEPLYVAGLNAGGGGRGRRSMDLLTLSAGTTKSGNLPSKQTSGQLNMSVVAYHSMNRFLTTFLEHSLSDLDYEIATKTFFELTLDMEFKEVTSQRAVFYNDNGHSFDSVLFYGNERTLFSFNLYLFVFVDLLTHNFVLAGIVSYAVDLVIKCVRNYFGKRNFARKTLIDKRFLI